jgi:hypothetical protein
MLGLQSQIQFGTFKPLQFLSSGFTKYCAATNRETQLRGPQIEVSSLNNQSTRIIFIPLCKFLFHYKNPISIKMKFKKIKSLP